MSSIGIGKWKVTAIDCGWHIGNYSLSLTPGRNNHPIKIPYMAFLLQNGEKNVLIDNGINDRFLIDGKAWGGCSAKGGEEDLLNSLKRVGLEPKDIDLMLYTHAHNDHAGNAQLFTDTPTILQTDEFDNLLNPCYFETQRRDYDFGVIPYLRANKKLMLIDGDLDVTEGIRIIKTPGHTRGSQSVLVNTTNGIRAFLGDLFCLRCLAFPQQRQAMDYDGNVFDLEYYDDDVPCVASTLIYNHYDLWASFHKLRANLPEWKPEYVICGHEGSHLFGDV